MLSSLSLSAKRMPLGLACLALSFGLSGCSSSNPDCVPDCEGLECGLDPVCGESCGTCPDGRTCNQEGQCEQGCVPDCEGRCCGSDGCGAACPDTCSGGTVCDEITCRCAEPEGPPGAPCPHGDQDCSQQWPVCLVGHLPPICSRECSVDADCGEGNCCHRMPSGKKYCFALSDCYGIAQAGEPCPFGNVNADAQYCDEGLACLGFAADGGNGYCPSGHALECTQLPAQWNPDCAFDKCGASFCAAECGDERSCPEGHFDYDVSGVCYCVPDRQGSALCTDPIENTECPEGEKCMPIAGRFSQCVEEGELGPGEECGQDLGSCIEGHMCASSGGPSTCMRVCDYDADTGCDPFDICLGIEGVERWGLCLTFELCEITNMSAECPADRVCIPIDIAEGCENYRCYPSEGIQEDEECTYLNSCDHGLLCVGTCKKICIQPEGTGCEDGEICISLSGCPETWGVCL